MRELIRKIITEELDTEKIECKKCGWTWKLSEGGQDKYICHKCGNDNNPKNKSNLEIVFDSLTTNFPIEHQKKIYEIRKFVENYIKKNNFNLKFSKSCNTGFKGVRTNNEIIICNPGGLGTLGDFIYTIFHEIRHESQIKRFKMDNPLSDYNLDDFEKIYNQYWEMELDADQFAKNMIAKIVNGFGLPIDVAKKHLSLSMYIKNYPSMSMFIRNSLETIIQTIKDLRKKGVEVKDARDLPMVAPHLENLEDLI